MSALHTRHWALVVPSFLLFWVLGLGFMWILVVPVALFVMHRSAIGRMPWTSVLLLSVGAWLSLSLIANVVAGEVPLERALGASFGAATWFAVSMLYAVFNRLDGARIYQFVRGLIFVSTVQGFLSVVAVFAHPSSLSNFRLPSSVVLSGVGGVEPWTRANLAVDTWFGEAVVRSNGLQATAAWSGGLACLVLIMLILKRRALLANGMGRLWWFVSVAAAAGSLYFSYTRVSQAILVAVLAYSAMHAFFAHLVRLGELAAVAIALVSVVLLYYFYPWQDFLVEQDELRPGSSDARFTSYLEGVDVAWRWGFQSLLLGSGAKPLVEELGRGAGSESTYVSLLVRGGILALVIFVILFWQRLMVAVFTRDATSFALIAALAIHAAVEDLDVGTLSILLGLIPFGRIKDRREAALMPVAARGRPPAQTGLIDEATPKALDGFTSPSK